MLEFFAPCPRGTEKLLAEELLALRCPRVRPLSGGVSFGGALWDAYAAMLWSRVASRVLLTLARVPAAGADDLYEAVSAIPWEDHVSAEGTIAVDASGTNAALRNTQFTAVRVKDAIADRFVAGFGRRPSVDTAAPDLRVNVVVRAERATIAVDLSGEPLHRRGYRVAGTQVAAPMKETLAAAVLLIAGWPATARTGGAFVDPLCGSGTLPIEAALIAGDVAPGLTRRKWGFDHWLGHDAAVWDGLVDEARARRDAGLCSMPPIAGFDSDARAVAMAQQVVERAGLGGHVSIEQRELSQLEPPAGAAPGLIATNPPYGERISALRELPTLYTAFAERLRAGFSEWRLAVITSDPGLAQGLRMTPQRTVGLFNGRIPVTVSVFAPAVEAPVADRGSADARSDAAPVTPVQGGSPGTRDASGQAFTNRLAKMAKHYGKWARRAKVGCYRVYDADLPDYAVAIDLYSGAGDDAGKRWVHVAEYAPPRVIDPDRAEQRLTDVLAVVPGVLDVSPDDVFLKTRQRQRGSSQYTRIARSGVVGTVEEGGLLFELNLSDYLDTGLFLDHRSTRSWVRELADGTRFLNLFAYTGTASVCAAAGGASSTTTVDLSSTYTQWSRRNLERNGFMGANHRIVRTDVLEWVAAARAANERYDLVFCDPPTFSNSKRMSETWDVQRDHAGLVLALSELLTSNGLLVFSCNRRRFVFDEPLLIQAGLQCEDVTARTIPKDFERTPGIHTCWTVRPVKGR
jgi:23S rRNA (guanine2445-N2)-methyltransferase / 23S rRNA (guanine2069-N7)-methyltransferase